MEWYTGLFGSEQRVAVLRVFSLFLHLSTLAHRKPGLGIACIQEAVPPTRPLKDVPFFNYNLPKNNFVSKISFIHHF